MENIDGFAKSPSAGYACGVPRFRFILAAFGGLYTEESWGYQALSSLRRTKKYASLLKAFAPCIRSFLLCRQPLIVNSSREYPGSIPVVSVRPDLGL